MVPSRASAKGLDIYYTVWKGEALSNGTLYLPTRGYEATYKNNPLTKIHPVAAEQSP